ncbi:MAG: hypothetical protein ACM3NN_11165 [Nitrospirota bacterium]
MIKTLAQFFTFALLRVFGDITVQVKALLFRWRRKDARTAESHTKVTPREPHVRKKMTGRFVAKGPVFVRPYFPFRFDEAGEPVGPGVKFWKDLLVTRQVFRLIVAVHFVFPELECHSASGTSTPPYLHCHTNGP